MYMKNVLYNYFWMYKNLFFIGGRGFFLVWSDSPLVQMVVDGSLIMFFMRSPRRVSIGEFGLVLCIMGLSGFRFQIQ